MKKEVFISICGGLIFSLSTQTILADEIPSRTLPMSEILKILQTR
ncbi:TPA: PepSY domain-containing protein, partial [Legionella pneumophila]|nr:PepSY domain-containing protein [Legionella pneumophila]